MVAWSSAPGWRASSPRFRLTYISTGKDTLKIKFEIAAPGKEFAPYLDATPYLEAAPT
jgi:hypothetical protein